MVGMQASIHTSVDDEQDLSKNQADLVDLLDADDPVNAFSDDDFDPDELLNSPLFNDFAKQQQVDDTLQDSFGSFAMDGSGREEDDANFEPIASPTRTTTPRQDRLASPQRTVSGPASFSSSSPFRSPSKSRLQPPFSMMPQQLPRSPSKLSRSPRMPVRQSPKRAVSYSAASGVQGNTAMPSMDAQLQQMQQQLSQMSTVGNGNGLSQSMHTPFTQSPQLTSMQVPQQTADNLGTSMHSESLRGSMRGEPLQNVSAHVQSMQQSMGNPMMNNQVMNGQMMQGQVMNGQMNQQQMLNAQGMNGQMVQNQQFAGQMVPQMSPQMNHQQMNQQMNGQFVSFQGNVSIATDMQSPKPNFPQVMGQQQNPAMGQGQKAPATLNDAMEKLCESMKRSAMTRGLVKQISSRSVSRQNSARGMGSLSRQNSARGIMRQNSARGMMKQLSNRALMSEGSGRGNTPIRRMSSSKHTLTHHGRGIYRHDSQQSLNSQSAHGMNLHIDGRNVGAF